MKINSQTIHLKLCILFSAICLLTFLPTFAQQQERSLAFNDFFKEGMTKIDGIFPVYQQNGNVYLEIPKQFIGREIEIRAQVNQGFDMIDRPLQSLGVVRLEMEDKQNICFQQGIFDERILNPKSELQQAFQTSNKQPSQISYPITAYTKDQNGYIIDITDILKNGDNWFQMRYSHVRALNPQHSKIKNVHAFSEGVSFTIYQMYGYTPEQDNSSGSIIILPEGYMETEIGCIIRLLPEKDMRMRLATDKIGFKTIVFRDFSQNPYSVVRDSIITRWNLGISETDLTTYRKGGLVEPLHPIVFYIDPYLPQEYIPAIKEAVSAWNNAFKRAGFKNAIQTKTADKDTHLEEQCAVIAYDLIEPGIKSSFTTHPRTGEILSCRINIGHGFIPQKTTDYLLQCGATDTRILPNRFHKEIIHNIMTSALMKSIGEILGLKPNYAGSAAYTSAKIKDAKHVARWGYTASIMDENPYHYAASPKDHIAAKNLVPRVGEYDLWAIGWAYKEFPKNKDCYADRESLNSYLTTADQPAHKYSASNHNFPGGKGDLTQERIDALCNGFENILYIFDNIEKVVYNGPVKDNGFAAGNFTQTPMKMYNHYSILAAESFGSALPLSQQQKAMELLSRYFFSGTLPRDVKFIRKNLLADISEAMARNSKSVFERIFSKELIEQLVKTEKKGSDGYTVRPFFKDLYQSLFAGFNPQISFTYQQMDMQISGITTWLEIAEKNNIFAESDIASAIMANEIRHVYEQLLKLSETHTDPQSRHICKILTNKIMQKLKQQ